MSPSYTLPTSSSASKAIPQNTTPKKKLKRPSTLPKPATQSKLPRFTPLDPNKPCPIATLPSEIHALIYHYVFPNTPIRLGAPNSPTPKNDHGLYPALLRVSRTIRTEAAYSFYTRMHFVAPIYCLNFTTVEAWVKNLPPAHRAFLAKNQNIHLHILFYTTLEFGYVGDEGCYHWDRCRRFGNTYAVEGALHKDHFLAFSKLADWFLWCSTHVDLRWNYKIGLHRRWLFGIVRLTDEELLVWFLKERLSVMVLPCVEEAWVREKKKGLMAKEALNMLESLNSDFDTSFRSLNPAICPISCSSWIDRVALLRRALRKWESQ
ncbi:hypothetical protein BDV95DRAFT_343644 [Massariosphaeria phaeospora]|uniref:F-box domain-containing protein n=1 Tax=Massariosphaeria phaeospora TaxID=100035 RepID=A0A7C8MAA2_9PLEO|nr:hypothetical protein BDV95DRAFT_343644 [Massariosphaeria phaeospora]